MLEGGIYSCLAEVAWLSPGVGGLLCLNSLGLLCCCKQRAKRNLEIGRSWLHEDLLIRVTMKDWLCSACSTDISVHIFDFSCWPGHSAFICDHVGSHLY